MVDATMTLEKKSAPCLWSDRPLTPEVGRLIRDAGGPWLAGLAKWKPVLPKARP